MDADANRARFLRYGLKDFSDTEAVELMLALQVDARDYSSHAKRLLSKHGTLSSVIDATNGYNYCNQEQSLGLRLSYELGYRYLRDKLENRPIMSDSRTVVEYLGYSMRGLDREHFRVIYLNGMNSLIGDETLSAGTVNQAMVYPREVVRSALAKNPVSLIIAHNHVSGNPKPSADDVKITCRLKDSCDLVGISLLDHIIIGGDRHYSFAKEGLM